MRKTFTSEVREKLQSVTYISNEKKFSLREVAEQTNITPSTLYRFLNGSPINSDALDAITEFLDIETSITSTGSLERRLDEKNTDRRRTRPKWLDGGEAE